MILYLVLRFCIIFLIVNILISLSSIFLLGDQGFSFRILIDSILYFIPHSLISAVLILYTIVLYKRKDKAFNKNLSNALTFKTTGIVFILLFSGLVLLGINFYFHEFYKVDETVPVFHFEDSEWEYLRSLEKVDFHLQGQLTEFVEYFQLGDYSSALKILDMMASDKKNGEKKENHEGKYLAEFLNKILQPIIEGHDNLVRDASKKMKHFKQAYRYFESKNYLNAIRIFSKNRYKYKQYFIQKAKVAKEFLELENRKPAVIKALVQLGEGGMDMKTVSLSEYSTYLKSLNVLFPNSKDVEKVLKEREIDAKVFGLKINTTLSTSHPLKQKLVIIENKLTLHYGTRWKKKMNFGKTMLFIGELLIEKGEVYFKNLVVLPNIDTPEKMMPAYHVELAHWQRTENNYKISIKDMKNLVKKVHLIPNGVDGTFKTEGKYMSFDELILANKVIKYAPKLSIFDLEKFYALQGDSNYIPGLFHVYINEKLSYYITGVLLWILAVSLGLVLRIRYEKILSWLVIVPMTLFIIIFSTFCFYTVKQIILMQLS